MQRTGITADEKKEGDSNVSCDLDILAVEHHVLQVVIVLVDSLSQIIASACTCAYD